MYTCCKQIICYTLCVIDNLVLVGIECKNGITLSLNYHTLYYVHVYAFFVLGAQRLAWTQHKDLWLPRVWRWWGWRIQETRRRAQGLYPVIYMYYLRVQMCMLIVIVVESIWDRDLWVHDIHLPAQQPHTPLQSVVGWCVFVGGGLMMCVIGCGGNQSSSNSWQQFRSI